MRPPFDQRRKSLIKFMKPITIELLEPQTLLFLLKSFDLQESLTLSGESEGFLNITAGCTDCSKISICYPTSPKIMLSGAFIIDALTFINALEMILSVCGDHIISIFIKFTVNLDFLVIFPQTENQDIDLQLHLKLLHSNCDVLTERAANTSIPFNSKTLLKLLPEYLFPDCGQLLCVFDENEITFELRSVKGSISSFYSSEILTQNRKAAAKIPISAYKSVKSLLRRCGECSICLGSSQMAFHFGKELIESNRKINISLWVS